MGGPRPVQLVGAAAALAAVLALAHRPARPSPDLLLVLGSVVALGLTREPRR